MISCSAFVTVNHRLNLFGYLHLADVGGARYVSKHADVGFITPEKAVPPPGGRGRPGGPPPGR